MPNRFWQRWLVVSVLVVATIGLVLVAVPALGKAVFGLILFGSVAGIDDLGPAAQPYIVLSHGVLGAVMIGWAATMLLTVLGPFGRGEWEAWCNLTVSLSVWFVADTTLSLATGFWQNAVLNVAVALLFAIPLAATYRSFRPSGRT